MYADIHHHLLHGLDDGPATFEETQGMILRARQEGISHIVATAHAAPGIAPFPLARYRDALRQARDWCRGEGVSLVLHGGAEVYYTDETPRILSEGLVPMMADRALVLLEFNLDTSFERMLDAARKVGNIGCRVVFAHIERYRCLRAVERVARLRGEYGVVTQLNADTVLSRGVLRRELWLKRVLTGGHIDVIASDAHNITTRACRMRACHGALTAAYGADMADALCVHTPLGLIMP